MNFFRGCFVFYLTGWLLLFGNVVRAQSILHFTSVDSLFMYAEKNSATIKEGNEQALLAKWTKLASIGNTINLRSPLSATWTDNTELPVNYIPSEALGGKPGTFRELSFGQTYVTNYTITPQIDIINPAAWARIKSASVNVKLTETNNLFNKKNLFESIAAAYFNSVSVSKQISRVKENIIAADSVFFIITNKYNQGIAREPDKNNAEINLLTLRDKLAQLNASLEQQYNALKILCDIQPNSSLTITDNSTVSESAATALPVKSTLAERQQQLESQYLKSELRWSRLLTFAPTLSFIFNQTYQESSNTGFYASDVNHFNSQYFGLKFTVPFPLDVNRLSQNYTSKINYRLSQLSSQHAALQNELTDKDLELDYAKALSTATINKKIKELKDANYIKSFNQYKEGIISSDILLLAFTDKVNAEINSLSAEAILHFTETKIKLNNTIQ